MSGGKYTAVDLFSGCGGLSTGLEQAGFNVLLALEIDPSIAETYKLNHPDTEVLRCDVRNISGKDILTACGIQEIDLLAGCPPCQGFSSMRRKNKRRTVRDKRNNLILEYLRICRELNPKVILMENVPALMDYYLFGELTAGLHECGYEISYSVLNASDYLVPQRRKRFVLIGSRIGSPRLPKPRTERITVRQAIGPDATFTYAGDKLQEMHSHHTERISKMISLIPKNGGSLSDLGQEYALKCHAGKNIGFRDVYGRMSWDKVSPTITGGCMNPSKGRFLHPVYDRSISAREAATLQTFPVDFNVPEGLSRQKVALMIGNALPPAFARAQGESLVGLLDAS